jgi:plasmid stabilization system protein ParE
VTRRIQIERAAELDIAELTIVLRERQPASAIKFVKAARTAFRLLATQPEMGRRYQTPHPLLQNLRVWPVEGFEKYLIFYRAARTSIYIERVLYGGRDIERVLPGEN